MNLYIIIFILTILGVLTADFLGYILPKLFNLIKKNNDKV